MNFKTKKKIVVPALALVLMLTFIGVFSFNTPAATPPVNMQVLDLNATDNEYYLSEDNYAETMQNTVEPFINQYKTSGYFVAEDGTDIYYEQYLLPQATAQVTISHGFTENTQKYKEVIYYFLQEGYSVYIMDHRGHGFSDHIIDDPSKVHLTDFSHYITDFKTFIDKIVKVNDSTSPLFLYAHSMGGGIGALLLENYPDYFDAAVLSSPMMEINSGDYPGAVANFIASSAHLIGFGKSYIFGNTPFDPNYIIDETNVSSVPRSTYAFNNKLTDTRFQLNAGTFSWLKEAFEATNTLTKAENASRITTPTLVFQASEDDMVLPGGHYKFMEGTTNGVAELILVEGARHELFLESNDLLIPYFNTVFDFYKQHLN